MTITLHPAASGPVAAAYRAGRRAGRAAKDFPGLERLFFNWLIAMRIRDDHGPSPLAWICGAGGQLQVEAGVTLMLPILPEQGFVNLSRAEVLGAINDPNPNAIANEVARLIAGHVENFRKLVARLGYIPAQLLVTPPASQIEAVARDLFKQALAEQIAAPKAKELTRR
jgi:hypothetical protein